MPGLVKVGRLTARHLVVGFVVTISVYSSGVPISDRRLPDDRPQTYPQAGLF
jgi:hypothetical protein